ncbi:MAG: transglutaminase family protein [Pseudomonadota bacterium]
MDSVATLTGVHVDISTEDAFGRTLIAPIGIPTPHQTLLSLRTSLAGGAELSVEQETGQSVLVMRSDAYAGHDRIRLDYTFRPGGTAYPEAIFQPRVNRFTRAADPLVAEVASLIEGSNSERETIERLVAHTANVFTYGHPEDRFYDGREDIPYLGCGTTAGSCIDINMYLIAALRSVGIEAGYVAGPFYPAEKNGRCDDMHCWVVTRSGWQGRDILEWDIAHHLKMGTRTVRPGLNPKPGWRAAVSHSMGWDVPALGIVGLKLLSEPMWVSADGDVTYATVEISSRGAL